MKYCQTCGAQLLEDSTVCSYCGSQCVATPNGAAGSSAPYQQNPYQQQNPYDQNSYQQAPYQQNPYQQAPYQNDPYQQNPYQQGNPYPAYPFQPYAAPENSTLSTCALIFAFLIPIVGLICGITGVCKYKTSSYRTRCVVAIVISVISWIFSFIILSGV